METIRCARCRRVFSTFSIWQAYIDRSNHLRCCQVPSDGQGMVIAKVGTHGSEGIKVTRGFVEVGKRISFIRSNGVKCTGAVTNIIRDVAVFIDL